MTDLVQALVFDLGGTHLRSGVLDASGNVRTTAKRRLESVATGASTQEVWAGVLTALLAEERQHRAALAADAPIVIAFPGPISGEQRILHAPTLTGDAHPAPDLAGELSRATGRAIHLLNDVSAAAWHFSERTRAASFMVVTVSSGIGSKLFDRRHVPHVVDDPEYAGEIGHFVVDDHADAPVCDCGGRGHLGAIASARAIERAARRRAAEDQHAFRASWLGSRIGESAGLTNEEHLVPAALAGDAWTLGVIRGATRPLARTLLGIVMGAGIERVFVIGGFAQALGDVYLQILRSEMTDMSRYVVMAGRLASMVDVAAPDAEPCLEGCAAFIRARLPIASTTVAADRHAGGVLTSRYGDETSGARARGALARCDIA